MASLNDENRMNDASSFAEATQEDKINNLTDRIKVITPNQRGCQISIRVKGGNKELFDEITVKNTPILFLRRFVHLGNFCENLKIFEI